MNNKKLKTSKVTIGLYACTGIVSVYALYAIFNSITYLRNYFKTYGSSIGEHFGDALSYILNQSLSYIVFAVLLFAASVILTEVINPENYISEGELQALAAAKAEKAAKAAEAKAMKEAEKAAKEASKVETATVETPKLGEVAVKEEVEEIAEKVAEEVIESK